MLSGEGNAGNGEKQMGLISKKATLHVQHTFLVHFFAVVLCTTTAWNFFMEEMSYVFSFTFFTRFLLALVAAIALSPSLQNFHVVLPTKKCLLCFLSLALDLCRPFSRWASLACRLLSLFLCLSLALYSKFVNVTINPSLILWTTRIQKPFSTFRFGLYWLFSCLCFTRYGWLSDFPPK